MNVNFGLGKSLTVVTAAGTAGIYVISPDVEVGMFTNRGAAGIVKFNLPPAKVGMEFRFYVEAAQQVQIDPDGTETVSLVGTDQGAGSYVQNSAVAIGSFFHVVCTVDGKWKDQVSRGTWVAV